MQARRNVLLGVAASIAALAGVLCTPADARPHVPDSDAVQLGALPAGTHHSDLVARRMAGQRIDMALPLAQFYIGQARSSGDLRYLGYAEAVLWVLVGNERAQRFYRIDGWSPDGAAQTVESWGTSITDVRWRRALP